MSDTPDTTPQLADLASAFEGAVPAIIATAAADGTPNVTFLSRVRQVDHERIALSNQYFSKTARNLAENPYASVLLVDPTTYDEYRLSLVYERTDRRGPVFDQLRADVEAVASFTNRHDVFRLRSADVYRVTHLEVVNPHTPRVEPSAEPTRGAMPLAELTGRLARCTDLDTLVSATVDGLAELLGYEHSVFLLLDESGRRLYTIASHGYEAEGVGSEVVVGEGIAGMAAARSGPIRVGNLRQMAKYSHAVRTSYDDEIGPGHEIGLPVLPTAQSSRVAVPAMALGQLVGVLMVEAPVVVAYDDDDVAQLSVVASLVANAVEIDRAQESHTTTDAPTTSVPSPPSPPREVTTHVRFFPVDGSTFLDGDYLIKGVAGRILWSLLAQYDRDGRVEFTNKEVRLDPSLELPEVRDNLDSRLILLKRRLEERGAPIQIEKTGRGRFRLMVDTELHLEHSAPA